MPPVMGLTNEKPLVLRKSRTVTEVCEAQVSWLAEVAVMGPSTAPSGTLIVADRWSWLTAAATETLPPKRNAVPAQNPVPVSVTVVPEWRSWGAETVVGATVAIVPGLGWRARSEPPPVNPAAVPWRLTLKVAFEKRSVVGVRCSVLVVCAPVSVDGEKVAVTPAGSGVAESATGPAKPPERDSRRPTSPPLLHGMRFNVAAPVGESWKSGTTRSVRDVVRVLLPAVIEGVALSNAVV